MGVGFFVYIKEDNEKLLILCDIADVEVALFSVLWPWATLRQTYA